tara:strand:+ start:444 stop:800 length:357 start_codon:yes stop_codon:yes gene_type:complete
MLLRRSGETSNKKYDLKGVLGEAPVGVHMEAVFNRITELVYLEKFSELHDFLSQQRSLVGPEKLVDAIAIASAFNGITRVANATGIPLDETTEELTVDLRELVGMEIFSDEVKSNRYS